MVLGVFFQGFLKVLVGEVCLVQVLVRHTLPEFLDCIGVLFVKKGFG